MHRLSFIHFLFYGKLLENGPGGLIQVEDRLKTGAPPYKQCILLVLKLYH
jgi:hypothetical protein